MLLLKSSNGAVAASFSSPLGGITSSKGFGKMKLRYGIVNVIYLTRSQIVEVIDWRLYEQKNIAVSDEVNVFCKSWKLGFRECCWAPFSAMSFLKSGDDFNISVLRTDNGSLQMIAHSKGSAFSKFISSIT